MDETGWRRQLSFGPADNATLWWEQKCPGGRMSKTVGAVTIEQNAMSVEFGCPMPAML
jgi:hypothetical protein